MPDRRVRAGARTCSPLETPIRLVRLRILLRLSHELGHLPHRAYERAARELNESGRMLGGWLKSCRGAGGPTP